MEYVTCVGSKHYFPADLLEQLKIAPKSIITGNQLFRLKRAMNAE